MVQSQTQSVRRIAFPILIALSVSHCLNDLLQSVISAVYPLFKEDLSLSFAQIGLITLVYQMSASVFQPLTGLIFDKRPIAWSLPIGMSFTLIGMLNLAFGIQSELAACFCLYHWNRFVCSPSGSIPYHLFGFGRKTGIGTITFSGRWKSGGIVRPFISRIISGSLWQASYCTICYPCFGGYLCNVSYLPLVPFLSEPS